MKALSGPAIQRIVRRDFLRLNLLGNLAGAIVTFFYFRYIDPVAAAGGRPGPLEIAYSLVTFAAIVVVGRVVSRRWFQAVLAPRPDGTYDRRRIVLVPYLFTALNVMGWTLAGLMWGVFWPVTTGQFSPALAARLVLGVTGIAGSTTVALIFFVIEHRWRAVLATAADDLEGDVGARFPVGVRLLVMFLLVSVVPLAVLGVFTYTRSMALVGAGPAEAAGIVRETLPVIVFVLVVGGAASVGLSVVVSRSVAAPLGQVVTAMGAVERGNLDTRCPVVANDEIGAVAAGFNRMLHGLREREFVKETFGKYVTREIRDEILAGRVALGGQVLEATILFADLRDFTPWVEATPPGDVVRELNGYFTEMEAAIREHRGLVLQFIGDEIEAVFGAPLPYPGHATMAARAALAMRGRLAAWNAAREAAGKRPLRHGIGIHTGTVLAGNIGSAERLSYALVGDAVNLASRLQQLTKEAASDILLSGTTRRLLDDGVETVALPAARVKGKSHEVEVYRLA